MAIPVGGETAGGQDEEKFPRGTEQLFRVLDAAAAERRTWRMPVVLFHREPRPDVAGERPAISAAGLLSAYRRRLATPGRRDRDRLNGLVPHAFIDDALLGADQRPTGGRAGADVGAGVDADVGADAERVFDDPHIALHQRIARELRRTMPKGSGRLRTPRLDVCLTLLASGIGPGTENENLRRLRAALFNDVKNRHFWLEWLPDLADALEKTNASVWVRLLRVLSWPAQWWYLRRLGARQRWLGQELGAAGDDFPSVALDFAEAAARGGIRAKLPGILVKALVRDLHDAVTRGRWSSLLWGRRVRRGWPFVVLLGSVGEAGTPSRTFLDAYRNVLRADEKESPLMIVGALTGETPPYADVLPVDHGEPSGPEEAADRLAELYRDARQEGVRVVVVPLSPADVEAGFWARRKVRPRARRLGDRVRPCLPVLALAAVIGATSWYAVPWKPASCLRVTSGEIVGITDGQDCTLAGPRDGQLRELERLAARHNAGLDLSRPYRSVVFYAPLTRDEDSDTALPTGLQILRGVLLAQHKLNAEERKSKMPIRILVANPGEFFRYGVLGDRNREVDVTKMIIDRAKTESIAAVIGITQSRPESLGAVSQLDMAQIPVIGTALVGSRMVDYQSPDRYFQITPTNSRIAEILARFAGHSEELAALTGPTPTGGTGAAGRAGGAGPATAIVVYDPHDLFFSSDLRDKFTSAYTRVGGKVELIEHIEEGGPSSREIAKDICRKVEATRGFILYAGRSAVMPDLFNAMRGTPECRRRDGRPIAVLAESPSPAFVAAPRDVARDYPFLSLFFMAFNPIGSDKDLGDYSGFDAQFVRYFPGYKSDVEAAGGYDSVWVVSLVVDSVFGTHADNDFRPSDVYAQLVSPGVQFLGTSGWLQLDGRHKYPPNKAIWIRRITPNGDITPQLACGLLPNKQDPAGWGPPGRQHECPHDK